VAAARATLTQERYIALLEAAITGTLTDELGRCNLGAGGCALAQLAPFDAEQRRTGQDWPPAGHTMVGTARLRNIRMALEAVVADGVPGDFMELGVWRGGACIFAKALLDVLDPAGGRRVVLLDAFGDIPGYAAVMAFLAVSEPQVRHNFAKYGVLDDSVVMIKGLFKDTVEKYGKERAGAPIAVLRLDSNFYDSLQVRRRAAEHAAPTHNPHAPHRHPALAGLAVRLLRARARRWLRHFRRRAWGARGASWARARL